MILYLVTFKLTLGRYHTGFNQPLWYRHTKDDPKGKHKAGDLVCTTFSTVEKGVGSDVYAKKTKWDNIPLALSNGSDPDDNDKGKGKKGVNKLDANLLNGIRQRMVAILKSLNFKRFFSFGANNADFFIPWIKPQLPDSTLFYTECDHMRQFYNPVFKPTKEAYLKLDIWLSLIASPLITFGRQMMNKQGPGYEKILLIQRQAKSDGGKMGDKAKKAAGGKIGGKAQNKPQHKEGEWYYAHCDNPDCVEKTADGKGKIGKSKVGGRLSQHRFKDGTGKEPVCGTYSIKVSIHL
jgi:hypothetical protein